MLFIRRYVTLQKLWMQYKIQNSLWNKSNKNKCYPAVVSDAKFAITISILDGKWLSGAGIP